MYKKEPPCKRSQQALNARVPWAVQRTKEALRMAEQTTAQGGLYLGNQLNLNQPLRFARQSRGVHRQSDDAKSALKATIQQADASEGMTTEG